MMRAQFPRPRRAAARDSPPPNSTTIRDGQSCRAPAIPARAPVSASERELPRLSGSRRLILTLAAMLAAFACAGEETGKSVRPTPMAEGAYAAALSSANATQVARNAQVERGTGYDPPTLIHTGEQVAAALSAYAQSLRELSPPSQVTGRHDAMVAATTKLADSERSIVQRLRTTGAVDVDSIPLFDDNNALLDAFISACRAISPPAFACGSDLQTEPAYRAALGSIYATQVASNAVVYRGTVDDPNPAAFSRFLDEYIAALEPFQRALRQLHPPSDLASLHFVMIRATEDLIASSRALRDKYDTSSVTEAKLRLLEKQGKNYLAFDAACRQLSPDVACGALIERRH